MGDGGRAGCPDGGSRRDYTAVMTSWCGPQSLALAALWGVLGIAVAILVTPPAEAGWRSYVVAIGILGLYVAAGAAFVRERRRKRRWI